jgi:hypothetical protein
MVIDEELTLDQSFTPQINLGSNINEGAAFVAQTYTAGINGILSGIRLNILSKAILNPQTVFAIYPLRVAIRQVRGGFPSATTLGETIVFDGSAPPDRLITFPTPILQEAGTQYAIVVNYVNAPPAGAGHWLGNWYGSTGDQYPDGELFYGPEGETWYASSVKDHDVQFQTYVVPN